MIVNSLMVTVSVTGMACIYHYDNDICSSFAGKKKKIISVLKREGGGNFVASRGALSSFNFIWRGPVNAEWRMRMLVNIVSAERY